MRPRRGEKALAIAAPYAAAVMEAMGLSVERLDGDDLKTVSGTYDVIVCEGAVAKAPASWSEALAPGGRLGVVERSGPQGCAVVYVKAEGVVGSRSLFDTSPPYLAGFEPATGFVF